MQTAADYLAKTESAVRTLFKGIDAYKAPLYQAGFPIFLSNYTDEASFAAALEKWTTENAGALAASVDAQRKFVAESYANAILCGAIFQVASMGLQLYSKGGEVPDDWVSLIKNGSKVAGFCTGRRVRDVPIGLVIYAARNQHMHHDDDELREPNVSVFERLATRHGYGLPEVIHDPAFDLQNPLLVSFAANCLELIEWRSYDAYESEMKALLGV